MIPVISKSVPLWRKLVLAFKSPTAFWLAFFAGILLAGNYINDTNVLANYIKHDNMLIAVAVYLLLGSWFGVAINFVLNHIVGRSLDNEFRGEKFISWKLQAHTLGSGLLSSVAIFAYLMVASRHDPTILSPLQNLTVVWLALYDWRFNKVSLAKQLPIALLVIGGAVLTTTVSTDGFFAITWDVLLLMGFVFALLNSVSKIIEQRAEGLTNSTNFAFWRFLWFAVTSSILTPLFAQYLSSLREFIDLLKNVSLVALLFVGISMTFSFLGNILRLKAQWADKLSVVNTIAQATTVLSTIPLTLLASKLYLPDTFKLPNDPVVWIMRVTGMVVVALALVWNIPKTKEDLVE